MAKLHSSFISCMLSVAIIAPSLSMTAQEVTVPTIHVETKLVLVDVAVRDEKGVPIRGLKINDFQLKEGNIGQILKVVDEHHADSNLKFPTLPQLPPNTFINYVVGPETNGPLTVVLLDWLNTPQDTQPRLLDELKSFVGQLSSSDRIAILALTSRNFKILQGFTQDPRFLASALGGKSVTTTHFTQGGLVTQDQHDPKSPLNAEDIDMGRSNADQLLAMVRNRQQLDARIQATRTFESLKNLTEYLATLPGRKNLIWFSGGFSPLLMPGIKGNPGDQDRYLNMEAQMEELFDNFTAAQITVYPIDARGTTVQMVPASQAPLAAGSLSRNDGVYSQMVNQDAADIQTQHMVMQRIAEETGGKAYFERNDLLKASKNVMREGSDYYTLAYSPSVARKQDTFRNLQISIPGHPKYKLSYRSGYYNRSAIKNTAESHFASAMECGSPISSGILYKLIVTPLPSPDKTKSVYRIDLAASPDDFEFHKDGSVFRGGLVFAAIGYGKNSRVLGEITKEIPLSLDQKQMEAARNGGLKLSKTLSLNTDKETTIRIGVLDTQSHRIGTFEVPSRMLVTLKDEPQDK